MTINPTIFREYDVRGRYPRKINDAVAAAIAHAYADSPEWLWRLVNVLTGNHDTLNWKAYGTDRECSED